jgi:very-short-patch-repair endonuclease
MRSATRVAPSHIQDLVQRHRGARGLVQLRRVLAVMDGGAESPQETRTRLVLLDGGLRRPNTQIVVFDEGGYPFARIDMGYEEFRVGVEYDGEHHWTNAKQHDHDIQRQVELTAHGWIIIRVSADMLRNRPWLIVRRAVEALQSRGCPWLDECGPEPHLPRRSVA